MRKTLSYLVVIMMISITFIGCKKGENDPFLSLLSRTARITGVWNLTSADYDHVYTDNGGSETYGYSFDGSQMTRTLDGDGETYDYSEKVTIDKDGTFKVEISEEDLYWSYNYVTQEYESGVYKTTITGVWYFLDGNKELEIKDKERVEFLVTKLKEVNPDGETSETDYSGRSNSYDQMFLLDKLANKEMVALFDYTVSEGSDSYQETGTTTYTRE
jgi:hypothetical protein